MARKKSPATRSKSKYATRRKSKYAREYSKARSNYLRRLKRLEAEGYILPESFYVPVKNPSKKAIEQLNKKRYTTKQKAKLPRVDLETGEIIQKGITKKRRKKSVVPDYEPFAESTTPVTTEPEDFIPELSYIIIENFKAYMQSSFPESPFLKYAFDWLDEMRGRFDDDYVASKLEEAQNKGMFPTRSDMYNMSAFLECIADLTRLFDLTAEQVNETIDWYSNAFEDQELY